MRTSRPSSPDRREARPLSTLRIVGLYALFAAAWIGFSDAALVALVPDPLLEARFQTVKGWFFVLVTALLLYSLVSRELARRARLEAELRARLEEKEVLLREVHHRVNNNLQVVASLLDMERDFVETEGDRAVMDAMRERVLAMGLVHTELSRVGDLSSVDLGAWLGELAPVLADALGAARDLRLELESVTIDFDRAFPVGLFLAEALSNAARHGGGSAVIVRLRRGAPGRALLEVRDTGPGFGAGVLVAGLGLRLAEALAAQAGGACSRRDEGGAVLALDFPVGASSR